MVITPETSLRLIDKYFNEWDMGLIKEPLNVDFVVDPRPLTEKERKMISDFIKADKLKKAKMIDRIKKSQKKRSRTKVS